MVIPKFPVIPNPQLLDAVIGGIQPQLISRLPWLDYAFGRAQKIVKIVKERRLLLPSVYAGKNNYFEVTPDQNIGNFSFWWIEDPQEVSRSVFPVQINAKFSLIFWFNVSKIWNDPNNRDTETLKLQVIEALTQKIQVPDGVISLNRIYEQSDNIYRGFTLDEASNQFLIHPFAGFRFEGVLFVDKVC